jgi:hypothetical protein
MRGFLNIARPPFLVDYFQPAHEAADEIVRIFAAIEDLPEKVSFVFDTLVISLALQSDDPLVAAGYRLAQTIDHDTPRFKPPYHNQQHVCEVMLCCHYLALRLKLNKCETIEVLLAALFHDFQHDSETPGNSLFCLERNSFNLAEPYLFDAGITSNQRRKLAALVLATNPKAGLPIAHACYRHFHDDAPLPEIPASAHELACLCDNSVTAKQALLLCAADLLPSLGLTIDYALMLQKKLALEWRTTLGTEDKLRFIDNTRHIFIVCDFFMPNIDRLRAYLIAQLQIQDEAG